MALSKCLDCTTHFAVGVDTCPHCGSTKQAEVGSPKRKAKRKGTK